jgi:pimeloyl-ACP methyl ester carboxylesterase
VAGHAAAPPYWSDLAIGPHATGYRQVIIHDPARSYPHPLAQSAQRPILVNLWYPAEPGDGKPMTVGDYLLVGETGSEPADRQFARLLERHVRSVFAQEVLGREPQFFDQALSRRLAQLLALPVLARRDAKRQTGTFPLVLAHPGLGGAFADNFVLYELLASHGYAVISSAFQSAGAQGVGISWEPATSIADLDAIASWARQSFQVGAVAALGHSYGAQAALIYAMEQRPLDAVISLDSTLENGDPNAPWYKEWKPQSFWLDRAAAVTVPVLLVSTNEGQDASFFNGLLACDRRSLKVPYLEHEDFATFGGVLQAHFAYDLRPPDPALPSAGQVAASNRLVIRAALAFLQSTLRKDSRALEQLDKALSEGAGAKMVHVTRPPTANPGDVLRAIKVRGVAAAASHCASLPGCDEKKVLASAGEQLLAAGEWDTAAKVLGWVVERYPDHMAAHTGLADALMALRKDAAALAAYQASLAALERVPISPPALHQVYVSRLRKRIALANELVAKGR